MIDMTDENLKEYKKMNEKKPSNITQLGISTFKVQISILKNVREYLT